MRKLKHFASSAETVDYIVSELISTLEDDLRCMQGPERQHYTAEDIATMRAKIRDVRTVGTRLVKFMSVE